VTRSGHFNPVFKKALRERPDVCKGIASEGDGPYELRTSMIEVWHCQVRVLLRAPARFRCLVSPLDASSPAPRAPRYRHQGARIPVPCRRRAEQRRRSRWPHLNPYRHTLPEKAAPACGPAAHRHSVDKKKEERGRLEWLVAQESRRWSPPSCDG
jgi:ribosomal protein L32